MKKLSGILFTLLYVSVQSGRLPAQTPPTPAGEGKLEYILVFDRHGVRTPLWSNDRLNEYSTQPWPEWDVKVGELTASGRAQMKILGDYEREYLTAAGLIRPGNCTDAARFYVWSDVTPRDVESGQWLVKGLFPGCTVGVHAVPAGQTDPMFSPFNGDRPKPDADLSAAALLGRIGGRPELLDQVYHSQLAVMERVLLGCDPPNCPADKKPKQNLLDQTSTVRAQPGRQAQLGGPLSAANTIFDSFELEYADGKPASEVGWGRLNKSTIRDLMALQEAYVDLALRTPYAARANASNLLSHMLRSMQQAVRGEKVPGALGKPGDAGLVIMGHDSNLSYIGGTLGINWFVEEYGPNCRPPGAALVFEIRREGAGKRTVRTYLMSQTLDQLRYRTPLSLEKPPAIAPIFIPGCGTAAPGSPCDWDAFQRVVEGAIDPKFVTTDLPVSRPTDGQN